MKPSIKIRYIPNIDYTIVTKSKDFNSLPPVAQLDVLGDAVHLLTKMYNKRLSRLNKSIKEYDSKR